ncbi:MAG: HNH endonuclease [Gemmatimonadota bacterium]|nr:HNH endonuclease [Gemmatimonadota bacterium]
MPPVSASTLIDSVLNAIQLSGGTGVYTSDNIRIHPREFAIQYLEETFSLWVYIWTLTPGGRPSLPDEYRIQMTSVSSPLRLNPNGYTALLGYFPDRDMFAGFDIQGHRTFTTGSPSVQIDISAIYTALQDGLAFHEKENREIAVAFRPDQFLHYIRNANILHELGTDTQTLDLVVKAAKSEEIVPQEIESLTVERRRIVTNVSRYARDGSFRQRVLSAYEHRCAVTQAQLKLVDAAHILPVSVEGSSDHVSNGIALSPTMHRAYDHSLIFLDENYYIRLNDRKATELRKQGLDAGLPQLTAYLGGKIHLPADRNQWPNREFIIRANQCRRIETYY